MVTTDNIDTALDCWLAQYSPFKCEMPKIAGKFKGGSLIIIADAVGVWDDLEAFGCKIPHHRGSVGKEGWHMMTINRMVEVLPGNIVHAYSNQYDILQRFIDARREEYRREFTGPDYVHSIDKGSPVRWPWKGNGTSLLGGVFVGLMLGYHRIVICGGPLDDGPHNGEPPWRKCSFTREAYAEKEEINRHWMRMKQYAGDRVRSMSGRTREWLGMP